MKDISTRLKKIRTLAKLSRADIARKYSVSQETLKAWEYGINQVNNNNVDLLLNIYRNEGILVTKEWLVLGKGEDPKSTFNKEIPSQNFIMDEPFQMQREISFLLNLNPDYIALKVTDDSMAPKFISDCTVIGKKRFADEINKVLGRDCIIKIKGKSEIIFRRLGLDENNRYILSILNPIDLIEEPIIIAKEIEFAAPIIIVRYIDY